MMSKMPWLVVGLDLVLVVVFLVLSQINGTDVSERINTLAFSLFPLTGAVILSRQPRNPVGWIVTLLGTVVMTAAVMFEVAVFNPLSGPAGLAFRGIAAWASMCLWGLTFPSVILLFLLFPNGRLPGPRWRFLALATVLTSLPVSLLTMVIAWRSRHDLAQIDIGLVAPNAEVAFLYQVLEIWNLIMVAYIVLALVSLIFRYARSRGIERLQLKWFVYGLATVPLSMILDEILGSLTDPLWVGLIWSFNILSIVAFPLVMLIAVTRYRLYDIDFIIRRTLLYSTLTLTLALIYFGSVLLMQTLFTRSFGEQPAIVVVLSTLLIAALFQPLRRRFQWVIDRRFYRSKYNTEQAVERFSAHLRSEVNLDEIQRQLVVAVEENIQPEFTELWLVPRKL